MKHRKLRIAWSLAWGVVAVLLCLLWVRSYWHEDWFEGSLGRWLYLEGTSDQGQLWFGAYPVESSFRWEFDTLPVWHINTQWPDFAFETGPFGWLAFVPHYALTLLATASATLAWVRWPKRFSLRTLLIVTTVIAAVLGIIVWLSRA